MSKKADQGMRKRLRPVKAEGAKHPINMGWIVAEGQGFEPWVGCPTTVFELFPGRSRQYVLSISPGHSVFDGGQQRPIGTLYRDFSAYPSA
jgi:hypothetical protein